MKFSFLGYNVKKIMEFDLDVNDLAILRYFEDELPFLYLGKRSIMMRMLKLRDLGILSHYTKKESGTTLEIASPLGISLVLLIAKLISLTFLSFFQ